MASELDSKGAPPVVLVAYIPEDNHVEHNDLQAFEMSADWYHGFIQLGLNTVGLLSRRSRNSCVLLLRERGHVLLSEHVVTERKEDYEIECGYYQLRIKNVLPQSFKQYFSQHLANPNSNVNPDADVSEHFIDFPLVREALGRDGKYYCFGLKHAHPHK